MKKILFLLAVLCSATVLAQFPEKDPLLLKGNKIKVQTYTDEEEANLAKWNMTTYENFYEDKELTTIYKKKNGGTPFAAVNGRTFDVTNVEVRKRKLGFDILTEYAIELTDGIETLYYKWYNYHQIVIPFKTVDMKYSEEYWDNYITSSESRPKNFTGEKPMYFTIEKFRDDKNKAEYRVYFYGQTPTSCTTEKGLKIVMEDDEVIKFPLATPTHAHGAMYMVLFHPDEKTVKTLSEKNIKATFWCEKEIWFFEPVIFKNVMARLMLK